MSNSNSNEDFLKIENDNLKINEAHYIYYI